MSARCCSDGGHVTYEGYSWVDRDRSACRSIDAGAWSWVFKCGAKGAVLAAMGASAGRGGSVGTAWMYDSNCGPSRIDLRAEGIL